MRILYVLPAKGFGGAERQALQHIRGLPQHGIEVVPVVGPGRRIVEALEGAGITDYLFAPAMIDEYDKPFTRLGYADYLTRSVAAWFAGQRMLREVISRRRVDAVFASRTVGWIMAGVLAHRLGLPHLWRGGSRALGSGQRAALAIYGRAVQPDALVCNCVAVARSLGPLVPAPVHIVYNGVDTTRFDPERVPPRIRRELRIPDETVVIGFAGRPAPGKGLETIAAAAQSLSPSTPLAFLICGDYGWRSYYQSYFEQQGLGARTTFVGHVADVETFFKSCDIVVLASYERSIEGLPNTVLEAMAMQRPVVASRVGGVPEIITPGEDGLLINSGDAPGLAEALHLLMADPALRERLGRQARQTILRRFADESCTARLAEVLRQVVGERRKRLVAVPVRRRAAGR